MPGLETLANGFTVAFTLILMLVGLFGLIIPIFPGELVIWLAALFYGLASGLQGWGLFLFIVITLLAIGGSLVDNVLMGAQARKAGASWWSLFFAALGGLGGTIFFPPFGGLLGAPLLLFLSEFLRHRKWRVALRITGGMLIGWGWSFLARFGIALVMIVLWGVWVWTNSAA
jgi:hypothetical protein